MQDIMQDPMQPFIKLVQRNMALLTQFSTSPDVISQTMANAQSLFEQGQNTTTRLAQSHAFGHLIQGMLKNYTDFMTDLGQCGMTMLAQGQSALMKNARDTSETLSASASGRSGARAARSRH
jgi:hypothetical protein